MPQFLQMLALGTFHSPPSSLPPFLDLSLSLSLSLCLCFHKERLGPDIFCDSVSSVRHMLHIRDMGIDGQVDRTDCPMIYLEKRKDKDKIMGLRHRILEIYTKINIYYNSTLNV